MSFVKYRVKEVAADFGMAPKEISEIIGKYYEKPKSNTQVLSDNELNVVFDYITQKNQISDMQQIFAVKATHPKADAKTEAPAPRLRLPKLQTTSSVPRTRLVPTTITRVPVPSSSPKTPPPRMPSPKTPSLRSPQRPLSLSASGSAVWWTPPLFR